MHSRLQGFLGEKRKELGVILAPKDGGFSTVAIHLCVQGFRDCYNKKNEQW